MVLTKYKSMHIITSSVLLLPAVDFGTVHYRQLAEKRYSKTQDYWNANGLEANVEMKLL